MAEIGENLVELLDSKEISQLGDELVETVAVALSGAPAETAYNIAKTIKDVAHLPTYLFWRKMERFLRGAFHNMEDQVQLASRFNPETKDYAQFVESLIQTINQIEISEKIDYYVALTRAFLLTDMERRLFNKLSKYILLCTIDELDFIKSVPYSYKTKNTAEISALYQYGLFTQTSEKNQNDLNYELSGFAIALKQNCLNFDEEGIRGELLNSYKSLKPLNLLDQQPISPEQISKLFENPVEFIDKDSDGHVEVRLNR